MQYASIKEEALVWTASLANDPPRLAATNDGFAPVLDGADVLTLWDSAGNEIASSPLPVDGAAFRMVLLDDGRVLVTLDDSPGVQLFETSDGQQDSCDILDELELSASMSATEFLAYDPVASAVYVGGNENDGSRRAVTRIDVSDRLTRRWTTAVEATSGSPRVYLRSPAPNERAAENLLVSQFF